MKLLALLVLAFAVLLCRVPAHAQAGTMPRPGVVASAPPSLTVDAVLWSLEGHAFREAILTFDHHPGAAEVVALEAAGLGVRPYRALPMVVVHGTGAQLRDLQGLAGLRSIFLNRGLEDAPGDRERGGLIAAATNGVDVSRLIHVDTGASSSVVTALEGFDWVFRNRLQYGIQAIVESWVTSDDVSPEDPLSVAAQLARSAGLATVERFGS
ncbi:MAG TPA: hypothetical protein VKA43_14480 [Gammaproteobacteria bacterium]|nr:hypothetical protein [Gammaproteobacteria bacterium]